MDVLPRQKNKWSLDREAFDALLAHLDDDRDVAGTKYLKIRSKLVKFFECRGCLHSEDHADETINRVARKLSEGKIEDLATYHFGVARMLFQEILREREKKRSALDHIQTFQRQPDYQTEDDARVGCFNACLEGLPQESREMIIEYYRGEKRAKIKNRALLAKRLGLSLNSLRIRAHRIRAKLEICINDCLAAALE